MSFFLVFVAIVLAAVAILLGTDLAPRVFHRRPVGRPLEDGLDEPVASLPPVLLPADPEPADLDRIRFAVGVRGYRMDQVDQVLDELRDQLARKDRELAAVRAQLPQPAPGRTARPVQDHPRQDHPVQDHPRHNPRHNPPPRDRDSAPGTAP